MISFLINSVAKVRLFFISAIVFISKSDEWCKLRDEWFVWGVKVKEVSRLADFLYF